MALLELCARDALAGGWTLEPDWGLCGNPSRGQRAVLRGRHRDIRACQEWTRHAWQKGSWRCAAAAASLLRGALHHEPALGGREGGFPATLVHESALRHRLRHKPVHAIIHEAAEDYGVGPRQSLKGIDLPTLADVLNALGRGDEGAFGRPTTPERQRERRALSDLMRGEVYGLERMEGPEDAARLLDAHGGFVWVAFAGRDPIGDYDDLYHCFACVSLSGTDSALSLDPNGTYLRARDSGECMAVHTLADMLEHATVLVRLQPGFKGAPQFA